MCFGKSCLIVIGLVIRLYEKVNGKGKLWNFLF